VHPALRRLMALQARGWLRRQITGGSPLRRLLRLVAVALFVLWMVTRAMRGFTFATPVASEAILDKAPYYIAVLAVIPLLFGNEDRALAFSPPEIDFLFAGPFARRDLVLYKLARVAIASLFGGMLAVIGLSTVIVFWPARLLGAALGLFGINLFATVVTLLREIVAEGAYKAIRWGAAIVVLGAVFGAAFHFGTDTLQGRIGSAVVAAALAPARVFAHVLASRSTGELALWSGLAILLDAVLVGCVLLLDKGYVEAALRASQRRQRLLDRVSKGTIFVASSKSQSAMELQPLQILGPPSAIVRRQAVSAWRTSRSWMLRLGVGLGLYGFFLSRTAMGAAPILSSMAMFLVILFPQMMRFDFRGDVEHIDDLKSLPISFRAIALAELAVPTALFTALALALALGSGLWFGLPIASMAMIALAIPPLALGIVALENFVFLLLPTRLFVPGQGGTLFFSGRRMLLMLLRLALFTVGGGVGAGVAGLAWWITRSTTIAYFAAWSVAVVLALLLTEAVARAFRSFDVSLDMPT
jgi:hypothetical protein